MTGFQNAIIHVYNKNENAIHDSDYFQNIEHRTSMILMGDSLGDLHMGDGAEVDHKLKIGFLNGRVGGFEFNVDQDLNSFLNTHRCKRLIYIIIENSFFFTQKCHFPDQFSQALIILNNLYVNRKAQ